MFDFVLLCFVLSGYISNEYGSRFDQGDISGTVIGDRSNDYSNMDPMINRAPTDWTSPRDPYSITDDGSRLAQDNLYLNGYDPMVKEDPDQAAYNYQLQQQEQQQLLLQQQQQEEQMQQEQYQQQLQLQQEQYQQYQYKVEPVAYQGKQLITFTIK
jgi:hypothetical protein